MENVKIVKEGSLDDPAKVTKNAMKRCWLLKRKWYRVLKQDPGSRQQYYARQYDYGESAQVVRTER